MFEVSQVINPSPHHHGYSRRCVGDETIRRTMDHRLDHQRTINSWYRVSVKGRERGSGEGTRTWVFGSVKMNYTSVTVVWRMKLVLILLVWWNSNVLPLGSVFPEIVNMFLMFLCIWNLTINNTIQYNIETVGASLALIYLPGEQ